MVKPYEPCQRGMIFNDDCATGDTLGYHCTIIRVHSSSVCQHPDAPEKWIYRVFVPHFDKQMDVAANDLFVMGGVDSSKVPLEPDSNRPPCDLRFYSHVAQDNELIEGAVRLPGRDWVCFFFRKRDQQFPDYQLRLPVDDNPSGFGNLFYNVPKSRRLDRQFVLGALADIVGVTDRNSE
jgi:hypothetical protein